MELSEEKIWEFYQIQQRGVYSRPEVVERQESLVRLILKKAPREGRLLEIGIGNGYLLKLLRNRYECFGVDISNKNVEITKAEFAKEQIDNIQLIAADITEHNFNIKFDIIVAGHILEHFDDRSLINLLNKIYTILNQNGIFVGAVPLKQDLETTKKICPNCAHIFDPDGHQQSFEQNRLKYFLKNAGFINIYTDTCVVGLKSSLKNFLRKIYYSYYEGSALQFMATRP